MRSLAIADVSSSLNWFYAQPIIPSGFLGLKAAFRGITLSTVCFVEDLTVEWNRNVEALRNGSHTFDIKVAFSSPQLEKASEEIERISKNPKLIAVMFGEDTGCSIHSRFR